MIKRRLTNFSIVRSRAFISAPGLLASIVIATVMSCFAWRGNPDRVA